MAQPTPPPTTATFFLPSVSVGLAQRSHEVCQAIAFLHVAEFHSGGANRLNNDGDGALFGIIGVDGDGDTLAVFIRPQDDKLTGLSIFGNEGASIS